MEDSFFKVALEVFKALTPFIIAFIVYLVWHRQKEKEVIASEAKNALSILNSMINIQSDVSKCINQAQARYLFDQCDNTYFDEIDSKWIEFDKKKEDLFNSLSFISDAKNDLKLRNRYMNLYDEIYEHTNLFKSAFSSLELKCKDEKNNTTSDVIEDLKKMGEANYVNSSAITLVLVKLKKMLLNFALYRK